MAWAGRVGADLGQRFGGGDARLGVGILIRQHRGHLRLKLAHLQRRGDLDGGLKPVMFRGRWNPHDRRLEASEGQPRVGRSVIAVGGFEISLFPREFGQIPCHFVSRVIPRRIRLGQDFVRLGRLEPHDILVG